MKSLDALDLEESLQFEARCQCGKISIFASKASLEKMLNRKSCRYCKRDYRNVDGPIDLILTEGGKWGKKCSGCNCIQVYTRKDHAKQSLLNDWQCKKCIAKAKGYSCNQSVGPVQRNFNKFAKSAKNRGIEWSLSIEQFKFAFTGKCKLTGWEISMEKQTASLDRIDSSKGYKIDNIQWVHSMVNMSKNKYTQDRFIEMCVAVANKVKW
jgi:hypothetical protein